MTSDEQQIADTLKACLNSMETLDEEVFGYAEGDGVRWPILRELQSEIRKSLAALSRLEARVRLPQLPEGYMYEYVAVAIKRPGHLQLEAGGMLPIVGADAIDPHAAAQNAISQITTTTKTGA